MSLEKAVPLYITTNYRWSYELDLYTDPSFQKVAGSYFDYFSVGSFCGEKEKDYLKDREAFDQILIFTKMLGGDYMIVELQKHFSQISCSPLFSAVKKKSESAENLEFGSTENIFNKLPNFKEFEERLRKEYLEFQKSFHSRYGGN